MVPAHGERDAEVAQAARRPWRVPGGRPGFGVAADDRDEVRAFGQEGGDGLVARGPQSPQFRVADVGRAGGLGGRRGGCGQTAAAISTAAS